MQKKHEIMTQGKFKSIPFFNVSINLYYSVL